RRSGRGHALHAAEGSGRPHGRRAGQQGLRTPERDAAGVVPRHRAVHGGSRRIQAATEGRLRGGAAGAARPRGDRHRRSRALRGDRAFRLRTAAQDPAQRAAAAVQRRGDHCRRHRPLAARRAAGSRGFHPAGERGARAVAPVFTPNAYTRRMDETPDYTLEIQIATRFLAEESAPEEDRYVFAYTIRIRNLGKRAAQLLDRHWLITDGNGRVEEVRGEGVVGEQPLIEPGDQFTYTSGA